MATNPFEESPDYVQSLARSLQVLRAFGHELPSPSLSEIAAHTDLSRAVVRRILEAHGGSVSAASNDAGGTVFHVTVPSSDSR